MKITEILVERYGPLPRRQIAPDSGLHVVYGPNEAGKTLLLEATLRLLEPAITKTMSKLLRIEDGPHGYVVVEHENGELQYDGDRALSEETEIKPEHLANIFVVRESDFTLLGDDHGFYASITEHIGDLHTSSLDLIESELLAMGRLTATQRKVSSATDADHAGDVLEEAEALAKEIERYVEDARSDGLDDLEGQLLAVRARFQTVEREVKALEAAELTRSHNRLENRLREYSEASANLAELESLSRGAYQQLVSKRDAIQTERERISTLQENVNAHQESIETLEEQATERRDELAPLEDRAADVAEVKAALEKFRRDHTAGEGLEDSERLAVWIALGSLSAGVLLQAVSFVLGQGLATVALLVCVAGLLSLGGYAVLRRMRHRREFEEARLVKEAQDAGFDVERREQIASELRSFEATIQGLEDRIEEMESEIASKRSQIQTYAGQISESRTTVEENREEVNESLKQGDVDTIEDYELQLEKKEEFQRDRERAKQSLVDGLGDPQKQGWSENVESWKSDLADLIDGVEEEVDASDYDEGLHEEKQGQLEELEGEEQRISERLEEHRAQIDRFQRRLHDTVQADPFLGRPLQLEAQTIDGLQALARELRKLEDQIRRDADVSRVALDTLDTLRESEERKITDLFAADGPATQAFHQISDGRYQRVQYDPEEQTLKVARPNGSKEFVPEELSKGTREQLYLAARFGLAERLLGIEPSFFLLDDPLLPADQERLTSSFEVLQSLTKEGWQILYFTSKEEVRRGIVDEFGLPLTEFDGRL